MSPVDGSGLASMLASGPDTTALRSADGPAAKKAAAVALEVTFLTQLLSAMRSTVPESGLLPKSATRTTYEGMFDRTMAETLAAQDPLGMVAQLAPEEKPR